MTVTNGNHIVFMGDQSAKIRRDTEINDRLVIREEA